MSILTSTAAIVNAFTRHMADRPGLDDLGTEPAYTGPTVEGEFTPTPRDMAEWLGMSLRLAREPMAELTGTDDEGLLLGFAVGAYRGLDAVVREIEEERAYDAWLDERERLAFGDPLDRIAGPELCGYC